MLILKSLWRGDKRKSASVVVTINVPNPEAFKRAKARMLRKARIAIREQTPQQTTQ